MGKNSQPIDTPKTQIPSVEDFLHDLQQLTGQNREWIIQYAVGRYFFESLDDPGLKDLEAAYFKDLDSKRHTPSLVESARTARASGGESILDVLGIDY
ncbi:hypothetical protein [Acidihalobacter ferrooxydans]|uniref:Uncharacterized protein n=1 Tax=Acidihalobacter ferrooxydans TaxID=1765967 RepID=A0A1P8UFC6_9GAMM|nr:hypothetical protein [Acidihalobacter ferrooxydans]APZ42518.1 hypothetical protein BW247_04945 [Acidihalobacter ferrooxydans]